MSAKRRKKTEPEVELLDAEHELPPTKPVQTKVKCLKCGRLVDNDKQSKWDHAARFHPDMFLRTLQEKIFSNNRGTDGLVGIGYELGKQLQRDGGDAGTFLGNLMKGFKRNA